MSRLQEINGLDMFQQKKIKAKDLIVSYTTRRDKENTKTFSSTSFRNSILKLIIKTKNTHDWKTKDNII